MPPGVSQFSEAVKREDDGSALALYKGMAEHAAGVEEPQFHESAATLFLRAGNAELALLHAGRLAELRAGRCRPLILLARAQEQAGDSALAHATALQALGLARAEKARTMAQRLVDRLSRSSGASVRCPAPAPQNIPEATAETGVGWFKIPGVQGGKIELARQIRGLAPILEACRGATVLDLGCAEGMVSLETAKAGARLVHGVELIGSRVRVADALMRERFPKVDSHFFEWNLAHLDGLYLDISADSPHGGHFLLGRYDIVLCLAIAQKLPNPGRFLRLASTLCAGLMAVRLPFPILDDARSSHVRVDVKRMLAPEFELVQETEGFPVDAGRHYREGDRSWLGIFRRARGR